MILVGVEVEKSTKNVIILINTVPPPHLNYLGWLPMLKRVICHKNQLFKCLEVEAVIRV